MRELRVYTGTDFSSGKYRVIALLLILVLIAAATTAVIIINPGEKEAPTYTVTMVVNGVAVDAIEVKQYGKAVRPPDPALGGYRFDGWFRDAEFRYPDICRGYRFYVC